MGGGLKLATTLDHEKLSSLAQLAKQESPNGTINTGGVPPLSQCIEDHPHPQ